MKVIRNSKGQIIDTYSLSDYNYNMDKEETYEDIKCVDVRFARHSDNKEYPVTITHISELNKCKDVI